MMTIATLLAVALTQNSASIPRVPETTLRVLAKGNGNDRVSAEALAFGTSPDETQHSSTPSNKMREEIFARAARQLSPETAKGLGPPVQITVKGEAVSRTPLANGAVLYGWNSASALLVPSPLTTETDEATMMKAIAKVVFRYVRIPATAQNPVTGQLIQERTTNGNALWRGSLELGYAPDENGVYKISDPKWHDSVSVWADGQFVWMQFGRDDFVMSVAGANLGGTTRKGGQGNGGG